MSPKIIDKSDLEIAEMGGRRKPINLMVKEDIRQVLTKLFPDVRASVIFIEEGSGNWRMIRHSYSDDFDEIEAEKFWGYIRRRVL